MKFGDIAEFDGAPGLRVMYLTKWQEHPKVDKLAWAVIVGGEVFFDGAVRGPGYVGPIEPAGKRIHWIDRGA